MFNSQYANFSQQGANAIAIDVAGFPQQLQNANQSSTARDRQCQIAPDTRQARPNSLSSWAIQEGAGEEETDADHEEPTLSAEKGAGGVLARLPYLASQRHAANVMHAEAKKLLVTGRLKDARRLLNVAIRFSPGDPALLKLKTILAPNRVTKSIERGPNRSAEYEWIRQNRGDYLGQWVAVRNNSLLAHAGSLKQLKELLRTKSDESRPLVYQITLNDGAP